MNLLSWLLLAAVLVWFVFALVRMIRNKGGCSCGGGHGGCGGSCATCGKTCGHGGCGGSCASCGKNCGQGCKCGKGGVK